MKLKPFVVATMISGLGLVGSAALAATNHSSGPACRNATSDYSAIVNGNSVRSKNGGVNVGTTKNPLPVCTTSKEPEYDSPAAGVPLSIGMIGNIESYYSTAGKYNYGLPFFGDDNKSYSDVYVKNVNLLLGSHMGIVHAMANLGYNNPELSYGSNTALISNAANLGGAIDGVNLNEAYISVYADDFNFPLYLKVGRQYINYGDYNVYSMLPSLTQQLTQVNGTGAELGFVVPASMGANEFVFFGNITGFGDSTTRTTGQADFHDRHPSNFSAKLGFNTSFGGGPIANTVKTQVDVSYLHNVADLSYYTIGNGTNFLSSAITQLNGVTGTSVNDLAAFATTMTKAGGKPLGALDVHANFGLQGASLGGLKLDVNYTTFLSKPVLDTTITQVTGGSPGVSHIYVGEQTIPWALSADGSYSVPEVPYVQSASLLLGGGVSDHAGYMMLPAWQIHAGLGAGITQNLSTQIMYQHNDTPENVSVDSSNVFMMQLSLDV